MNGMTIFTFLTFSLRNRGQFGRVFLQVSIHFLELKTNVLNLVSENLKSEKSWPNPSGSSLIENKSNQMANLRKT